MISVEPNHVFDIAVAFYVILVLIGLGATR